MSDKQEFAYIGRKPCGCIVAAVVDSPERRKDTAQKVAGFIADGLTVERVNGTLCQIATRTKPRRRRAALGPHRGGRGRGRGVTCW